MSIPTYKEELLAVALEIEAEYGATGPMHIAERIGNAVRDSDAEKIAFWQDVAKEYQNLLRRPSRPLP